MSSAVREFLAASRPRGFSGRGDKYLAEIAQDLRRRLLKTQHDFRFETCRLPDGQLSALASLLVEFAEDIHAEIGLWRALEAHNQQCFGSPLPFFVRADDTTPLAGFDTRRLQHLLWTLWPSFKADVILSPTHKDLQRLAEVASEFLTQRFAVFPKDSGAKRFLATENRFGWEIKRKLVWLGTQSYLFRLLYVAYVGEHGNGEPSIGVTDDFVCQICTVWSGLGVIDVLAGALDVPESDRATLRTWYERHASFYRVLTTKVSGRETEFVTARNVVNGQIYTIRMGMPDCEWRPGLLVFGGLTPWRGEWYWSGEQHTYGPVPEDEEAKLRAEMLAKNSSIAYRYCPKEAETARDRTRDYHGRFVAHYGNDLVVFPDGLSLAAAEQKRMEAEWRAAPPEKVEAAMREHGLTRPVPRMRFPPEFLNHQGGVGAFYNPAEGEEFMSGFNDVLSGLRKRGAGLSDDEQSALWHLMTDGALSPAFVRRLVGEHGADSIAEAFCMRDQPPELALAFLLRCHKGEYYRKRYPSLSLTNVGPPENQST
ncbi:MAG: DUF3843 family protein [Verrucomicrobia bacterium]|nr:DUF3843 family protein [Verrucomicrobiota bacterium]